MLTFPFVPTRVRLSIRPLPAVAAAAALTAGAAAAGSPALAAPVEVLPTAKPPARSVIAAGVTHERLVRDGGQVVHVIRAQANGRTAVRPVLAAGSTTARGSLTGAIAAEQDRLGVLAGVNGDFFNYTTGNPSGLLMIDRTLIAEPEASRSSLLIRDDGLLDAAIVAMQGRWKAEDRAGVLRFRERTFQGVNRSPQRAAEAILYTTAYGRPTTPKGSSLWEARIRLDDPGAVPSPGAPLTGTVVATGTGGGMAIGRGHVVLTGVGSSGATMAGDLENGRRITITPGLVTMPDAAPLDPQVLSAIGGGPLLVRDGRPVYDHREGLSSAQTGGRTARTAVGQTAAGTILLVTAEGPVQGSPGITAAEQAKLMSDLGARVAVAMDAGGSAQMALGTRHLVSWGAAPRSLSDVILLTYAGLHLAELPDRITPNADRVADTATAVVRTPVAGRVTLKVARRNGRPARTLWAGDLGGGSASATLDPRRLRLPDGVYTVTAELRPQDGSAVQTQRRRVIIDRTLGSLSARAAGRGTKARLRVGFKLSRPARVTVVIRNSAGTAVATLARGRAMRAGAHGLGWNRRVKGRAAAGTYRVEVIAAGAVGRSGLVREVRLRG